MSTNRQVIAVAVATFAVGLLTGALVFSQVQPVADEAPARPVFASQGAAEDASAPSSVLSVGMPVRTEDAVLQSELSETMPNVEPDLRILLAQIDDIRAVWGRVQADLAALDKRIDRLEERGSEEDPEDLGAAKRFEPPRTSEEQRDALLRAGVTAEVAEDLVWRRAQISLERLELRDEAARDGWLNTERYRDELRKINEQRVSMRDEIGIDAYDRYLFETGQDNRVLVNSVIPGSVGESGGIRPGDIIETYAAQRMFDFRDLRGATSDGERGELVPLSVRRGSQRMELWLPRGPIGIGLDATRVDPLG